MSFCTPLQSLNAIIFTLIGEESKKSRITSWYRINSIPVRALHRTVNKALLLFSCPNTPYFPSSAEATPSTNILKTALSPENYTELKKVFNQEYTPSGTAEQSRFYCAEESDLHKK